MEPTPEQKAVEERGLTLVSWNTPRGGTLYAYSIDGQDKPGSVSDEQRKWCDWSPRPDIAAARYILSNPDHFN